MFVLSLQAQTNFIKGYYISNSGDTIHGYIEYRSESRNYDRCVFREDANLKPISLYPADVAAYCFDNQDFYEREEFKGKRGETIFKFFRVLVAGKATLLRYSGRYFARDPDGGVFEITKRKVTLEEARATYYTLGNLKVLMSDCEDLSGGVLEKEYQSTTDFVHLFQTYNSCVGTSWRTSRKAVVKANVGFGLQVSSSLSYLDFDFGLDASSFKGDVSFGLGTFASLFLPRVDERVRIMAEANYSRYRNYSFFSMEDTNNDLFINFSSLSVPVYLRYGFDRFFVDAGVNNQFIVGQSATWRVETLRETAAFTSEKNITPFYRGMSGYLIGLGINQRLAECTLRSSLRLSRLQRQRHPDRPSIASIELVLSVQLR